MTVNRTYLQGGATVGDNGSGCRAHTSALARLSCHQRKSIERKEPRRHLCVLSTDVVESVPVVVRQSCQTLEAHVAELLLSLARLQSQLSYCVTMHSSK